MSKIPVVLKDREGKVVGQTEVPVSSKGKAYTPSVSESPKSKLTAPGISKGPEESIASAMVDYFTPAVGQAGKPLSVKGPFDGDFANTSVRIGNQTAKFLASSPRKVVVESPRDLNGVDDIEVEYKGKVVAKCVYRSISIGLAADKLNLIKGEQTSLTVTLAGLIGLSSPVSIQLTNKSPGTISMAGGDMQAISVNPGEVKGDIWKTTRALTGVQAGGFAINALVDPLSSTQGNLASCNQGTAGNLPLIPKTPAITGRLSERSIAAHAESVDADGNPRTNDEPPQPVNQLRGTYRVTFMGFTVNQRSNHGLLQQRTMQSHLP